MGADVELWQSQRQIREMERSVGLLVARIGELAAELAIGRQDDQARTDELGRLIAAQADRIRWLEGEVSRIAAVVAGVADDVHRERHYRQTGQVVKKSPVVPQDGRKCADGLTPCLCPDRALVGIVGDPGVVGEAGSI